MTVMILLPGLLYEHKGSYWAHPACAAPAWKGFPFPHEMGSMEKSAWSTRERQ